MASSYVRIDPVAVAAYVRDGGGPVMRDLMRRMTRVQAGARAQVGKRSRKLERSIVKRPGVDGRGPFVFVGSDGGGIGYAYWHHEGTVPHIIRPRRRKVLRFLAGGQVVFASVVHHPGTSANRYLTDSLWLARL